MITARDIPGQNIAGILQLDQPAIARDKVRFIGDPVAAVFAETSEIAETALGKIRVDYRVLEAVYASGIDVPLPPAPDCSDLQCHINGLVKRI